MSQNLKIGAYVILLASAIWCGYGFFKHYSAATAPAKVAADTSNEAAVAPAVTNQTDSSAQDTNIAALTNTATATNVAAAARPPKAPDNKNSQPPSRARSTSSMMAYGAGLVLVLICFGLLIAHDFSRLAADRFEKFIFDEDLEGAKDPEYEEAEKVWANGQHLEAIQLMRDYLKTHPREQYVALRIAEIYEKDLGNFLAAALEYEEILKKKLPDDRWGWAAIHLSNLYSGKLNRGQESVALLQRIVAEYGHTAAANKARERLNAEGIAIPEPIVEQSATPPAEPSNLPPGFRKKT